MGVNVFEIKLKVEPEHGWSPYPQGLFPGQCCHRDHNRDGNCAVHAAPGLLRTDHPSFPEERKRVLERYKRK